MSGVKELEQFFNEINPNDSSKEDDFFLGYCFIAFNEFHWNFNETMDCPCPIVLEMLKLRNEKIKREEEEIKKAKRKK